MGTVVMSSAGESLAPQTSSPSEDDPPILPSSSSSSSIPRPSSTVRSPRCEAFVMTGDKILNLNPHISPSYAKVAREQLPPRMSVQQPPQSSFSAIHFPSTKRGRLHSSISQPNGVTITNETPPRVPLHAMRLQEEKEDRMDDTGEKENQTVVPHEESCIMSSFHSRVQTCSNPQIVTRDTRTVSSETFVMAAESPSKMSSITVNGMYPCNSIRSPVLPSSLPPFTSSCTVPTRSSSFSRWTAHAVLSPWTSTRIDAAIREFLAQVELKGETSQRERILMHFTRRYYQANNGSFNNFDEVHALACGLLLLNSDLHNSENTKKMTCREFINNMAHTGHDYGKPLLKTLYQSIKETPLAYAGTPSEEKEKKMKGRNVKGQSIEADPRNQIEYKRGFLMRKVVYESDGTATPLGRRGWRMYFVRLRALALYFSRDESEPPLYNALSASVLLHHALAEPATDYTKRKHVLRLRTAGMGELLFQTSCESELESWVSVINCVAASFSSRSLPPALNSRGDIIWHRLPRTPSSSPLEDQMAAHESSAAALRDELQRLQRGAPPVRSKGKTVERYFYNERLLMQEISRYESYCTLLRSKLNKNESDSGIVSKTSIAADESERLSYREAMHLQ